MQPPAASIASLSSTDEACGVSVCHRYSNSERKLLYISEWVLSVLLRGQVANATGKRNTHSDVTNYTFYEELFWSVSYNFVNACFTLSLREVIVSFVEICLLCPLSSTSRFVRLVQSLFQGGVTIRGRQL